jgi:hypothetical protein
LYLNASGLPIPENGFSFMAIIKFFFRIGLIQQLHYS